MFEFQIPYYIGPISPIVNGDHEVLARMYGRFVKKLEKYTLGILEQKIDTEESAAEIYLQNGKTLYLYRRGRSSAEKFTFVREVYGTK